MNEESNSALITQEEFKDFLSLQVVKADDTYIRDNALAAPEACLSNYLLISQRYCEATNSIGVATTLFSINLN